MTRAPSPEALTVGVALIGLGVLWTLSNLGRIDMLPVLRTFWPLTLVVWGAAELLGYTQRRGARGSEPSKDVAVLPSQLDGSDGERS